ncbi:MAG: N-acetylmuramoyl-L-alanine amidase [Nocardioides sp.]
MVSPPSVGPADRTTRSGRPAGPSGRLLAGVLMVLLVGCAASPPDAIGVGATGETRSPKPPGAAVVASGPAAAPRAAGLPLDGVTIVLDPGHQRGNRNFPDQVNRLVDTGGFSKPCNTTGTATNAGFPESAFNFRVALRARKRLVRLGARVVMTRRADADDRWGPCVDVRGRAGNKIDADLKISIHADGGPPAGRGFHVIAPTNRAGWTTDIYQPSRRLARTVRGTLLRRGFTRADYVAGGDGLDFRGDLGTLNWADVPTVVVESGNMRNAGDAAWMSSRAGRRELAVALVRSARRYLDR